MKKFIPYEKLSKKEKRKLDQARRQIWGALNPVTRKPENSKAYNRKRTQDWKKEFPNPASLLILYPLFMCGKNLVFKTSGIDGCDCAEILSLIEAGKIDTTPLITRRYRLEDIKEAYRIFENKLDGVIKIAVNL